MKPASRHDKEGLCQMSFKLDEVGKVNEEIHAIRHASRNTSRIFA